MRSARWSPKVVAARSFTSRTNARTSRSRSGSSEVGPHAREADGADGSRDPVSADDNDVRSTRVRASDVDRIERDPPGDDPADDASLAGLLLERVDVAVVRGMGAVLARQRIEVLDRA